MICRSDISDVKTDLIDRVGQKIIIKGTLGKNKDFEKECTLEKAYSNFFLVKDEKNERVLTYTYTDLLTRNIEMVVKKGEQFGPLLPPLIVSSKKKEVLKEQHI